MTDVPCDCSIVIVSWNAKALLLECLESISTHSNDLDIETIVVDNASSDDSVEGVKNAFPAVRVIENADNAGFAKGNNIGIAVARGRYVCLVNSDVVFIDDCLRGLVRWMDEHPEVGMAGPRILNRDRTLQLSARRAPTLWRLFCEAVFLEKMPGLRRIAPGCDLRPGELAALRKVDVLSGCLMMVRRMALEEVGGLDDGYFMYAEDDDWCRRFLAAGWGVVYNPTWSAVHYGGGSSRNAPSRFFVEMKKAQLRYLAKHYGPFFSAFGRCVFLVHCALRWAIWRAKGIARSTGDKGECGPMAERYGACIRWLIRGS
ncbi:glycosyltransferase family 2 protein [Candidatus Sumerlaeota bacterium]|nr:glycosyltransferase family 2 protein [Candidatus Sumerlaeota bacterium]